MMEDRLEQEALGWLADVGWQHRYGPDLAPDGIAPERDNYRQVLLIDRLRQAVAGLNPTVPQAAREDAVKPVPDLGTPVLLAANRQFHRLMVGGVPVQYPLDDETRGDFVRLVDWADPARNEWLAVNQFSITGPHHTRRPDIVLFVNGLPLVLIELKNPADPNADVCKAFQQIQTYKEQIADAFQYNEVLVISDGNDALLGSLSADSERFMAWRTIDGVTLDPLGPFNELQTLVRGLLAPACLLDYLRYFVLFEDDGHLVKKIAGYHQFHAVCAAIAQVIAASRPDGLPGMRGKGGLVWHTQGSGKSITMTCFAARVMQEPLMENPTIVVITDRNDLDGQLFGVFSLARDPPARAAGAGRHAAGTARAAGQPPVRRHRVRAQIVKLRPAWHSADPERRAIKIVMTGSASDRALLRPHIYSAQVNKRLERRFKDPGDALRLVIVRDMWLTGFDAPCVHTMYVDKPMKGHNNESAVREPSDETLKKIAHELAENLRKNLTVDWSARESVQAKLRLMVKRILRKYKYPPDQQEAAVELVLQQAKALGEAWA
jgi:type I site-specific restriction-modification system R (restriction) subunit